MYLQNHPPPYLPNFMFYLKTEIKTQYDKKSQ